MQKENNNNNKNNNKKFVYDPTQCWLYKEGIGPMTPKSSRSKNLILLLLSLLTLRIYKVPSLP